VPGQSTVQQFRQMPMTNGAADSVCRLCVTTGLRTWHILTNLIMAIRLNVYSNRYRSLFMNHRKIALLEEGQDVLRFRIGNRQGLNTQLLLGLERLQFC
jgi:hypothetical protein